MTLDEVKAKLHEGIDALLGQVEKDAPAVESVGLGALEAAGAPALLVDAARGLLAALTDHFVTGHAAPAEVPAEPAPVEPPPVQNYV